MRSHPVVRKVEIGKPHNNRCQRCGERRRLTKHHVVYKSNGGDNTIYNIEWICRPCHDKEHGIKQKHKVHIELGSFNDIMKSMIAIRKQLISAREKIVKQKQELEDNNSPDIFQIASLGGRAKGLLQAIDIISFELKPEIPEYIPPERDTEAPPNTAIQVSEGKNE